MSEMNLDGVFAALTEQPRKSAGAGRTLMFIAARRKEGVSTVACVAAKVAGPGAVYGIDLDLRRNTLARAYATQDTLGPKVDGKLNGASFYQLVDAKGRAIEEAKPAFSYHRVGRTRLFVGAFDGRAVPEGGRVMLSTAADYWNAARAGGATVIIDAPALERSQIALRIARHMDGVVLVVGSDPGAAPAALAAKKNLIEAGANLMGLVYTGATAPVMAMEKLLRAG